MFIDTHCHLNMMVKNNFDTYLTHHEIDAATPIIERAMQAGVTTIINVGTSLIESKNCIALAQHYKSVFATIGIHPNDATPQWNSDMQELEKMARNAHELKIVGIGECGIDKHYPDFNLIRQRDVFRAHIDLALEYDLALVIHSRDAADETLSILDTYKGQLKRAVMHCFSYDLSIAQEVIDRGFLLGIDAPITYPKNQQLRDVVIALELDHIVLETDAPFLPPQHLRGKQNSPEHVRTIAEYIAVIKHVPLESVAQATEKNAKMLFRAPALNTQS